MKALVRSDDGVALADVASPELSRPGDVRIHVVVAGVCRTDLYVAAGQMPCEVPRILGHELSGFVAEVGPSVIAFTPGDRVTVMPAIPCESCQLCRSEETDRCPRTQMLGIDLDGAFAEELVVPERVLCRLPEVVSFRAGAYAEPLAAALAVLRADLDPTGHGFVYGKGRIAEITHRLMRLHGYSWVVRWLPGTCPPVLHDEGADFIVATEASTSSLRKMITATRPGGTIVLKSRPPEPVGLDLLAAHQREVMFRTVRYGDFAEAVALLADDRLAVEDLLGPIRPLAAYEAVFANAWESESQKIFFGLHRESSS